MAHRKILTVGVPRQLFERLGPLLRRAGFEVDHVFRGKSALLLATSVPFDLVLVGDPLPDLSMETFLHELRSGDRASGHADLLLMTEEGELESLAAEVDPESVRIADVSDSNQNAMETAAKLLGVPPRRRSRSLVKLEAEVSEGPRLRICQTDNVSETGMFLRIREAPPVGSHVKLEWTLPGDEQPIRAEARVVRHARADADGLSGAGLAFLELAEDDRDRLQTFLAEAS